MSTRSGIGKVQEDGSIRSVYCHWDGYLAHVGKLLVENYYGDTLDELLANGGISSLASDVGVQHEFSNPFGWRTPEANAHDAVYGNMTTFYARDRGEDLEFHITQSVGDYLAMRGSYNADYMYLYKDGVWYVAEGNTFVELEPELYANKITFSKRMRINVEPIEGTLTRPLLSNPNTELSVA